MIFGGGRGGALSGALALATLVANPSLHAAEQGFVAPAEPMKLTRVLERELGDGNAVVVTRSWRVRFVPRATGYRVEGEQIAVEVDAPPRLARFAEIERDNPQTGLFPIALDRAGIIVFDEPEDLPPIPGLTAAAEDFVEDLDEAARARAMRYVLAVQQAGGRMSGRWPPDLFYPAGGPRTNERALPVPGGEGSLEVRFIGALDPAGERLARAERRIVTRVGGTSRASLETWRLEPLE